MKKFIFIAAILSVPAANAGVYADMAKAKFESEVTQSAQASDMSKDGKLKFMSSIPKLMKVLREEVRSGLKEKKSCGMIKRDFIKEQKALMKNEEFSDADFADSVLSASGDYIGMICLDMK